MKNVLSRLILLLLLCLCACSALGEEPLHHATGELFADGGFPIVTLPHDISKAGTSGFDSYVSGKIAELASSIDVSRFALPVDTFNEAYPNMLNRHPELFYAGNSWSYYTSGGIVTSVLPHYRYSLDSIPARIKEFNAAVDEIVDYASRSFSDVGRLLRVYDYFCANYKYDTSYSIYSADQFFKQKKGVCQAYTLAYKAIIDRLGIKSTTATSDAMNHIWNMVKVDGKWYHIDVTWGDPLQDIPLRVNHDNFLRSDEGITEERHYSWVATPTASSTKYDDYFWTDITHALCIQGDTAYYSKQAGMDFAVIARDLADNTEKEICRYGVKGDFWGDHSPIWLLGSDLYYVYNESLYLRSLDDGSSTKVHSAGSYSRILGMYLEGDTLKFYACNGYNADGKVYSYTANINYSVALNRKRRILTEGEKARLTATITPETGRAPAVTFTSGNTSIAAVSSTGVVTAKSAGVTSVTAALPNGNSASCRIVVHDDAPLALPAGTTVIEQDAFRGAAAHEALLPEGVTTIESGAFADCAALAIVNLPDSLTFIAQDAFAGCSAQTLNLICHSEDSYAAQFAAASGYPYWVIPRESY